MDKCLLSTEGGYFHYRFSSPCIFDTAFSEPAQTCLGTCQDDIINYGLNNYSPKYEYPIGVSKDGRVIYGPYNSLGMIREYRDTDICNGITVGTEGTYAYAASGHFPYIIGC